MSYESSWNDPATWETSMAWHSVERSMSTIFKRAYESYRQILQPTVLYMYSMDFHGIPGTSPGGFCWSSPVRQLGPGRLSDQKKQWKLIHRDVWAHISQLKTRRGNLLTPDTARHCLPNLERKRNDMLALLESPQNFPMQKVRDGWVPCKSILWLYRVLGPTWVGRVCWYVDSHSCTARFWDFGVARNLYKDMIAFCFCLMI